jgi:hypothetical protein
MYQYTVHKANFFLLEVLISYFILPNVNLPVSPPSIFLIWFRTRIIGTKSNVMTYGLFAATPLSELLFHIVWLTRGY